MPPFGDFSGNTGCGRNDFPESGNQKTVWAKQEKRKTVFFVTHDVDEALLLANRILVFGQSPSNIIYDCKVPDEERPTRENQFDDPKVLERRNTLIKFINGDIASHIS